MRGTDIRPTAQVRCECPRVVAPARCMHAGVDAPRAQAVGLDADMPSILFTVEHRTVPTHAGRSIREVALDEGIYLNREWFRGLNCGGRGICGTCKVWVAESRSGATTAPNARERFHGMVDGRRLACQCRVHDDIAVTSMPGGDDRLGAGRRIDPAPMRAPDPADEAADKKAATDPEKGPVASKKAAPEKKAASSPKQEHDKGDSVNAPDMPKPEQPVSAEHGAAIGSNPAGDNTSDPARA